MEANSPDFIRGLMISLCALVVGAIVAGMWQAYHQRYLPAPRRTPIVVTLLFSLGYALLVVQVGIERWMRLGEESLSPATILGFFSLSINFLALALIVHRRDRDVNYFEAGETKFKEHSLAVKDFQRALKALRRLNAENWNARYPNKPPPAPKRYEDELLLLGEEELGTLLKKVNGEEVG